MKKRSFRKISSFIMAGIILFSSSYALKAEAASPQTFINEMNDNEDISLLGDALYTFADPSPFTVIPKAGYTLNGYKIGSSTIDTVEYEFTMPAEDVTVEVLSTPNSDTRYTVNHYKQRLGKNAALHDEENYEKVSTIECFGTTDTEVTPSVNTYTGFVSPDPQTVSINGNGNTVVDYYYPRDTYEVKFVDHDNRIIQSGTYQYGETITAPSNPTRDADNSCTYTFREWSPAFSNTCTESRTYTAVYDEDYILYSVKFLNYDNSVVSENNYRYDEDITIPNNPTRTSDDTYYYTFSHWTPSVSSKCKGSQTYTAVYTPNYIDYTITFKDENGAVLSENNYHYGELITPPESPTKGEDDTYTYVFAGWEGFNPEDPYCYGNAIYVATYNDIYKEYTVTFKDYDGNVISENTYHYNDSVEKPSDPTRADYEGKSYTFSRWEPEYSSVCKGNTIYLASYSTEDIAYNITFINDDNSIISSGTYYYGDAISVPTAVKEQDDYNTYTFAGWSSDIETICTGDAAYTATYTPVKRMYTIDYYTDDDLLYMSKQYGFDESLDVIDPPTKAEDEYAVYSFKEWSPAFNNICKGNASYKATYTPDYKEYTVSFLSADGSVIDSKTYKYGEKVSVPANVSKEPSNTTIYTFDKWDKEVNDRCQGDVSYTAVFKESARKYKVTFVRSAKIISEEEYEYGNTIDVPKINNLTGWTDEIKGKKAKYKTSEFPVVTEDIVYYAILKKKTVSASSDTPHEEADSEDEDEDVYIPVPQVTPTPLPLPVVKDVKEVSEPVPEMHGADKATFCMNLDNSKTTAEYTENDDFGLIKNTEEILKSEPFTTPKDIEAKKKGIEITASVYIEEEKEGTNITNGVVEKPLRIYLHKYYDDQFIEAVDGVDVNMSIPLETIKGTNFELYIETKTGLKFIPDDKTTKNAYSFTTNDFSSRYVLKYTEKLPVIDTLMEDKKTEQYEPEPIIFNDIEKEQESKDVPWFIWLILFLLLLLLVIINIVANMYYSKRDNK